MATLPAEMTAIAIREPGAPEVLVPEKRPMPQPGAGEVLVKVAAAGVNRPDVMQRQGKYPPPPGAPSILGLEIAGTIVAVGPDTDGAIEGQPVCALIAGGGYAEYVAVPFGQCLPVPAGFSDVEAASLPETYFTVWQNIFEIARLQPDEALLVQGGTSGIGVTAIQLAKAIGARVLATACSDDKCAACLSLGADGAINYRTQDFVAETRRLTDGRGVDVVLENWRSLVAPPGISDADRARLEKAVQAMVQSDAWQEALAFDPQTAGGLLVSLPADRAAVVTATFAPASRSLA